MSLLQIESPLTVCSLNMKVLILMFLCFTFACGDVICPGSPESCLNHIPSSNGTGGIALNKDLFTVLFDRDAWDELEVYEIQGQVTAHGWNHRT